MSHLSDLNVDLRFICYLASAWFFVFDDMPIGNTRIILSNFSSKIIQ